MIDKRTIFEIQRLKDEGYSNRRIAVCLNISRRVVKKYLDNPVIIVRPRQKCPSKLDAFKEKIVELLKQDPGVSSMVIKQHIDKLGYGGGRTILRDYVHSLRDKARQAYIRFESMPGRQFQIDWGYFGVLVYGNTKRKLYCFVMLECHSRLMYIEFTHSMKMDAFLRCHYHAFLFFGGTASEIVHDNLKSAVIERVGKIIRFNERYLEFLRYFHIVPIACNVRAAWEKGKVEKSVQYIRNNFWSCRTFTDLSDVNRQAWQWLSEVANVRIHATTGEKPLERYQKDKMRPLPGSFDMDLRDHTEPKVHTDCRIEFDGNKYTVPSWLRGKTVTAKADNDVLSVYYKGKRVAAHPRSWERKKVIEDEKHIKSILKGKHKALRTRQEEIFFSLGETAEKYVEGLARNGLFLDKSIAGLLDLKDAYGTERLLKAIDAAMGYGAYGVDYVENILYQQSRPEHPYPKVILKNEELSNLRLHELDLKEYDALIMEKRQEQETEQEKEEPNEQNGEH